MYGLMNRFARIFALLGGGALSLIIMLTCFSILGRGINSLLHSDALQSSMPGLAGALLATGVGPVNGDFELVEAGMAFTIFAFMPLCHLNGAHASVDIFTARLPLRANRIRRMAVETVFAVILVLIAWKLYEGTVSKRASGQTSLLLQFPVWWAYAFSLSGALAAAAVSICLAALRLLEAAAGRRILPPEMEADR